MSKPRQKKNILAALAGIAVVAAVAASASTLGGLTTERLGAESQIVASPLTEGVSVAWQTTYDPTARHYLVSGFDLTANEGDIPEGAEVRITLHDAGGEPLAEYVSTDGGSNFDSESGSVRAHDVHGASVVIVD